MPLTALLTGTSSIIQQAVAPVFLLTGIGSILGVMTNRLARIIDRARKLEDKLSPEPVADDPIELELAMISRRAWWIARAITLCTLTALLICGVVMILFLGAFFSFDATFPVAALFIAAMICFFLGLCAFLREIFLGLTCLQFGRRRTPFGKASGTAKH